VDAPQPEISVIDSLYLHRDQGRNLNLSLDKIKVGLSKNTQDPALLWREGRDFIRLGEKEDSSAGELRFYEQARKVLEESLQLQPHEPDAHYWLGVALGRIGQSRGILRSMFLLEPLRQQMDITLSLDPRYEPALHVLGEVYLELPRFVGGNLGKAASKFKEARAINPNDLVNLLSLGKAYRDLGEKEKALNVLNAALAVNAPADPGEYQDNRKDIQKLIKEISDKK
jgi:tetratricopeptide (TPR) repeat protein